MEYSGLNVLEASAGTGKTYALAIRYIQLLFYSNQINTKNILAITFTNKAMLEMKRRILEILKQIALDSFKNKEEEKEIFYSLKLDKELAKNRARNIVDDLIKHYDFFSVQTIDSFINIILVSSALNLGLSLNFKIKKDFEKYIEYSFDLLLEEAYRDKRILDILKDFLKHYLFVENRKGWFPKEDILKLLISLFEINTKYGKDFVVFEGESKDIIKDKKELYKTIKKNLKLFKEKFDKQKLNSIYNFINKNTTIIDLQNLPEIFSYKEPPIKKDAVLDEKFKKIWEDITDNIRRLIEFEAKLMYNPYVKLFLYINKFLDEVSRKEDILFLEDLNRKAKLLFDKDFITVPEIYYRLATKFNHYLIDEFQDTSLLQWNNLKPLLEDALASGGSLFYVGDKKQAIYRFRGGEVELFDKVKDAFSHFNVKEDKLSKNFRSDKFIVEFNNKIFSQENLYNFLSNSGIKAELQDNEAILKEITSVFLNSEQTSKNLQDSGYVFIERIDELENTDTEEVIKEKLFNLLDDLKERFNFSDIAILVRENSYVELITSWLISKNIAVESEKTLNVKEHPLIKEIICFLKFLDFPFDDISFTFFILGDIFLSATGIDKNEIRDFIFNLNKDKTKEKDIPIYKKFKDRYSSIWLNYIEYFFENFGLVSNYELIIEIYKRFKIFDNFNCSSAFFMKFLELLKIKEDEFIDLRDFLEYLKSAPQEELYVNVLYENAVKVLTIHKAKGLEFKVVILPFLKIDIDPRPSKHNFYLIDIKKDKSGLVRIVKNYRKFSKELSMLYQEAYKSACIDELNTVYVALTRPKHELYIFIPKKSNNSINKAYFLIPEDLKEYGKKIDKIEKSLERKILYLSKPNYKDWIYPIREEFIDKEYIINRKRIEEGNILHTILSKIGNCYKKDIDKLISKAILFARSRFNYIEDFSFYQKKIKDMLNKKEFYEIFYIEDGEVFCEKEIVDEFGNLRRIDRLIFKKDKIVIVDFKSSVERESQIVQLKEYIRIIGNIYSNILIKGILVYFDNLEKEEFN